MSHVQTIATRPVGADLVRTLTTLVAWLFLSVWLGLNGALGARGAPPIGLGVAIVLPFALFALDARLGHPLLGGLVRLEASTLIALQTFRVLGLSFLVAWWHGGLPGGFALPAGIGDVLIGLTAPLVAATAAERRRYAKPLVLAWSTLGVLDLVLAVGSGVAHSRSSFGVLAGAVTTDALARYPFSVVPTFFVPLALILHYLTFRATARTTTRDAAS